MLCFVFFGGYFAIIFKLTFKYVIDLESDIRLNTCVYALSLRLLWDIFPVCLTIQMNFARKRKISIDMFIFEVALCQQISSVKYLVHVNVLVRAVHNRI